MRSESTTSNNHEGQQNILLSHQQVVQIKSRFNTDEIILHHQVKLGSSTVSFILRNETWTSFLPKSPRESVPGGTWVLLSEANIQHSKSPRGFPLVSHRAGKKTNQSDRVIEKRLACEYRNKITKLRLRKRFEICCSVSVPDYWSYSKQQTTRSSRNSGGIPLVLSRNSGSRTFLGTSLLLSRYFFTQ